MNSRPHAPEHDMHDNVDQRFDQDVRQAHATAVARISPKVRAQLAQRRHAAMRGEPRARQAMGFRHAGAAFAAVCAVAIGMTQLMPASSPPVATPVAATSAAALDTNIATNTILDEDPDFYAWLASTEGQQLAME